MKYDDALISFITRVLLALLCDFIDSRTPGGLETFHFLGIFFMLFAIEPAIFFLKARFNEEKEEIRSQEQAEKKSQQKPED